MSGFRKNREILGSKPAAFASARAPSFASFTLLNRSTGSALRVGINAGGLASHALNVQQLPEHRLGPAGSAVAPDPRIVCSLLRSVQSTGSLILRRERF